MITKLLSIQEDVQRVAEAISSSLGLETEIVDNGLRIIAGTGEYKRRVGLKEEGGNPQAGYIYGRVVTRGKAEIVEDARNDLRYDPGVHNGTTKEFAEICFPIISGGKILGVIGLIAFNEAQQRLLIDRKNQLMDFVQRMAELLASKAIEKEILESMVLVSNQLRTIIESVDNGILAIDKNGMITHCNQLGADLIRRSKQGIIGKHILKIWAGSPMLNVMKSGEGYDWREEVYQRGHANMHFMVSVKPVLSGAEIMGAVATFRDVADVRKKAYEIIAAVQRVGIDDIWGESPHARELKKKAALVARNNATVLITGETGTGKGLVANAIHHSGPRSPGPFISVNCGAIPENLLESELFGYNEGAFSGAMKGGKPGKFELAVGGSILLDEIGDMPLRLQPKLLHVLQAKVLERLGGLKQIPVDARVIASTNKNLEKMILENEFRQDLFFRLNVIPIHIPPLRDRKEDILLLLDKFMEKHCRLEDKEIKRVSSDVRELFLTYHWPGNIRELENTVQYMVSMETGTDIGMEQVPSRIKRERSDGSPAGVSLEASLESYEKDLLRRKLAEFGADKEKLADMMRVSRATLYRKLKKFGL